MRLKYLAIALVTAFLICQTATAQTGQQGRIFRDPTGATFIYGLQPAQKIQAVADFATPKYFTSNACGLLIVKHSTKPVGKIRVEGVTIDPATLPTQLIPKCQGGQLEAARTANFKTAAGDVVLPKAVNRRYQIFMLNRPLIRNLKANICGFLKFPSGALGEKPALPTTTGGMARFAMNQLPPFPPLLCKSEQLYASVDFPPQLAMSISPFDPNQWESTSIRATETQTEQTGNGSQAGGTSQTGGTSQAGGGTSQPGGTSQTGGSQTGGSQAGGTSQSSGSQSGGSQSGGSGSQAPTISPIATQTFNGNTERTISFTIQDADTPLDQIQLTSNVASFPNDFESSSFAGTGASRTLTIKPKRSSSNVPIQISASDGTNTTSQGVQFIFAMNPAPDPSPSLPQPRFCRGSGGFVATRFLRPNTYYEMYFDDWSDSLQAASNELGSATFAGEIPPNEWSDGMRDMAIYEDGQTLYYRQLLANIPAC